MFEVFSMFIRFFDKLFLIYSFEFGLMCSVIYCKDHCPSVRLYPKNYHIHFARISFNRSLPFPIRFNSSSSDVK